MLVYCCSCRIWCVQVTRLHEELEACADAALEAENQKVQQQLQAQAVLAAMEAELDDVRGQLVGCSSSNYYLLSLQLLKDSPQHLWEYTVADGSIQAS